MVPPYPSRVQTGVAPIARRNCHAQRDIWDATTFRPRRSGVESSHAQRMEALDRDGFVAIPRALGAEAVCRLTAVVDRTYDRRAASGRLAADGSLHLLGFVSRDPAFRQLVDLADPLALVAGVLGWNIYVYHCHLDVHPPCPGREPPPWRWHQDGGRQNVEVESNPRPRLSLKVAHFLTDLSEPGRGNMMVIPGSHLRNTLPRAGRSTGPMPASRGRRRAPGRARHHRGVRPPAVACALGQPLAADPKGAVSRLHLPLGAAARHLPGDRGVVSPPECGPPPAHGRRGRAGRPLAAARRRCAPAPVDAEPRPLTRYADRPCVR
jgi:hypothetical protein